MNVPILIDGKMVQVDDGSTIFEAAKKAGASIPTLCHHEFLKPYGSCRLCMVEISHNRQRRIVTSCNFPVEGGMEVFTDTARVRKIRRIVLELLLARCPDVPLIQSLAAKMGIEASVYKKQEPTRCILCGLCVRFCEEVVGVGAIGLANRGVEREVATPFKVASETCIGCGSCTYICPTGCIEMMPDEKKPRLRSMKMEGHSCQACNHDLDCETCPTDREFMTGVRQAIAEFRGGE